MGVGDRVQGGEEMMKTEIDRIRRAAVVDAHAALSEPVRADIDECADVLIEYVKFINDKNEMSRGMALEVWAAIGQILNGEGRAK